MSSNHDIPGWPSLIEWLGFSPTFHDSEVVAIDLRRDPEPSIIRIAVWRTNADLNADGTYRRDRQALAVFALRGIKALRLEGWNHQNVLSELTVEQTDGRFVLHLPEIYGVEGMIEADHISVEIEPT